MSAIVPVSNRWFTNPWVLIGVVALVGVPAVFVGLAFVGVLFVNPVTWFLGGAVWFGLGFRHYRHRLTIQDTPQSKIDAAAIGLVEVSGRARSSTPITAPISGKPCVYWRAKVDVLRDNQSTTIADHHSPASSFEIEDDTGRMLVWPWSSELIVTDSQRWEGAAAAELAKTQVGEALRRHYHENGHTFVITEEKIEVGRTLYVLGVLSERLLVAKPKSFLENIQNKFHVKSFGGSETRTAPTGLDMGKALVLAISMVVWGLATGTFSLPNKLTELSEEPPNVDPRQVLIRRGEKDRPFIIADTPEGVVIGTLTRWTKLGLLGGAGIMVGTLILLLGGFFS